MTTTQKMSGQQGYPGEPMARSTTTERLQQCAKAATPGPWHAIHRVEDGTLHSWEVRQEDFAPTDKHNYPLRICESVSSIRFSKKSPDADFIAAANPQTILKLTALVEALSATVQAFMSSDCATYYDSYYNKDANPMDEYWKIHRSGEEALRLYKEFQDDR